MPLIFISYRRKDSAGHAGRLYDRLYDKLHPFFGPNAIFMDVREIEPGYDFAKAIEESLKSCLVLLAIIGERWLTVEDPKGRRRLDDPQDLVRFEIATALKQDIHVIPVLVEGSHVLREDDNLPEELQPLLTRNAWSISDEKFHADVDKLILTIKKVIIKKSLVKFDISAMIFKDRKILKKEDFPLLGQVIRREDIPLKIIGSHISKNPLPIWVVLQDNYERYYLQNPPVEFTSESEWIATNIRPLDEIQSILFVRVDFEGDSYFRKLADEQHWGAFGELPPGSVILDIIHIQT